MLFIFDMGGVVTNTFKMDSLYQKLGISKEEFFKICQEDSNIWPDFQNGFIDAKEFWDSFNKLTQGSSIPRVKNDLFRLTFHPSKNLQTIALIKELKEAGHRLVCGTNTIQSHWENHLERGDYSFFNQTYASNKIGLSKPDRDFFKVILEAEGYQAKDAFFTDDKIENVQAAKEVGINAYHFDSAQGFREYLHSMNVL
ncbi:MAG: HAD family phosphatase [Treponema sp.]|nr:HAD family phosphatase [Treponema sp.]